MLFKIISSKILFFSLRLLWQQYFQMNSVISKSIQSYFFRGKRMQRIAFCGKARWLKVTIFFQEMCNVLFKKWFRLITHFSVVSKCHSISFMFPGEEHSVDSTKSIFRGSPLEGLDKLSDIVTNGSPFPLKQINGFSSHSMFCPQKAFFPCSNIFILIWIWQIRLSRLLLRPESPGILHRQSHLAPKMINKSPTDHRYHICIRLTSFDSIMWFSLFCLARRNPFDPRDCWLHLISFPFSRFLPPGGLLRKRASKGGPW